MNSKQSYYILGFLSAILFGLSTPLSKLLLLNFNEFTLAGLLYLGGAIGLSPLIIKKKEFKILKVLLRNKSDLKKIIGSIIFGGVLGPILLLFGLRLLNAGSVSIWLNMELVATAIIGYLFFKESIDKNGIIGIIFTVFSGILISLNEGLPGIFPTILVILACFCWGIDNQTTGTIENLTPLQTTFIKSVVSGCFNSLLGYLISYQMISMNLVFYSLSLGFVSYGLSIFFYIITAQQIGSTRAQILFSSAPIIGYVFSIILLSEIFYFIDIISLISMLLGLYFSTKSQHIHSHKHKFQTHIHKHSHNEQHHSHSHNDLDKKIKNKKIHTHLHSHEEKEHTHQHLPDIHHRHDN